MRRSVEFARARGRAMEELLQYDVSSMSSLFDPQGMMTKPQKSAHIKDLEAKLCKNDERAPTKESKLNTACIVDVMASSRKL